MERGWGIKHLREVMATPDQVLDRFGRKMLNLYLLFSLAEWKDEKDTFTALQYCVDHDLAHAFVLGEAVIHGKGTAYLSLAIEYHSLFGLNERRTHSTLGPTPLHLAVTNNDYETVRALLQAGADPTMKALTLDQLAKMPLDLTEIKTPMQLAVTGEMLALFAYC